MDSFGPLLKRYREARRVSQSKLAEQAAVEHSSVSRCESGQRRPSQGMVNKLATALDLSDAERTRLAGAAGFLSANGAVSFANPLVRDVNALLTGELSVDVRNHAIMGLSLVKDYLERAGTGEPTR